MAEKIEWFYLNWTEYEIWWWAEYNAGEWIGIVAIHSDMQWPAPEWFHIPLTTEWQWLKTIMDWLSITTWDNWRINLHMPFVGIRNHTSADISSQGTYGYYWSSSPFGSGDPYGARSLYLDSSRVNAGNDRRRAYGLSVRCFKNSFELPTSSWTVINGTLWSAWIFWDTVNWLISITGDGTTWYTIQDKNLWATTVYNNGDTLTQANMWNMYQWWNNYWFPSTWSITTSSIQVDASTYWPWNYYSSSTFITWSQDWSSVYNDNLRWGETQWTWVSDWNTIINTGVLSVNGQTWNVTIQTGGNYTAGTWIDITNDEIWLDGTYEWTIQDYSAMRWPCDEWFHIPSEADITLLLSILNNLNITTKDQFSQYLKYPVDWSRDSSDWKWRTSRDFLWIMSCSATITNWNLRIFNISTNETLPLSGKYSAIPLTTREIRPFKNGSVSPTSSWTTLYDWSSVATWAWIFHSATDWLISISSDGKNFITIADKNLWAINVYNYWDTITEDNGWKSFQWWNNYPFPYSDDITNLTTDTTDLSAYWPWNYYYSQTLFTNRNSWVDTSLNTNLRWWATWVVQETISWNLVIWDKLYKIVTSTTEPASWTASNVITIVTD